MSDIVPSGRRRPRASSELIAAGDGKSLYRPAAETRAMNQLTSDFFSPLRLLNVRQGELIEPYKNAAWVYACIRAIAQNIMQVGLLVRTGPRTDPQLVESDPWVTVLQHPNPLMTAAQLKEAVSIWLNHSGEVAIVKESGTDARVQEGEVPAELWPIDGKLFQAIVDPVTKLPIKWAIYADGHTVLYDPHEIVWLRRYNPYDPLRGLAPLTAAMQAARSDYKVDVFNEAFIDNDATPGIVLSTAKTLTLDQRKSIREAWEERHQGAGRRRRVAVLEGGMTVNEMGVSHREMEFIAQKTTNRDTIAAIFKVPKSELNLHESLNFATALSADRGFWTKTLIPEMKLVSESFTEFGMRGPNQGRQETAKLWLDWDWESIEALHDSMETKMAVAERMHRTGVPWVVINEKLDMKLPIEKIPFADQGFLPSGMVPVEQLVFPEDTGDDVDGEEPGETEPPPKPAHGDGDMDEDPTGNDAETIEDRRLKKPQLYWKKFVRSINDKEEPRFRSKWTRFLMELRTESLRLLQAANIGVTMKAGTPLPEVRGLDDALFNERKWADRVKQLHRPLYVKVSLRAVDKVNQETGGSFAFEVDDERVQAFLESRERLLVDANRGIRRALRNQLAAGMGAGESVETLAERIKRVFNFAKSRSYTIARTEVAGTVNGARYLVMTSEEVKEHEWVTAGDELVRDSHAAQDGVIVKVGERFPNGLLYPGQIGAPADEVVNCRCIAVPVVKGKKRAYLLPWIDGEVLPLREGEKVFESPASPPAPVINLSVTLPADEEFIPQRGADGKIDKVFKKVTLKTTDGGKK